ncbi:MAG: folylpolyglutamate synthase/dihydrofolate synthase family protein [Bacteroidales bacterium]
MNYQQTIDYLYGSLPVYHRVGGAAYKANLDNTHALDRYFGHPHRRFRSVHIAGTNGKGSVSHMIASILAESGYVTGLYTSPHLRDFRERIKVNGVPIGEEFVVSFVNDNREILERLKPSFFEMTVAMAFHYFAASNVQVAVVETGMGGRLDSTNIITPLLSVITNIGLDHTQFLGPDLESIAGEKAGIIKEEIPVVIGETADETRGVFERVSREKGCSISFADSNFRVETLSRNLELGTSVVNIFSRDVLAYGDLHIPFAGKYQEKNIQTVMQSVETLRLNLDIPDRSVANGFSGTIKNTSLEGRWQVVGRKPLVVCDTAHNHEGLSAVLNQVSETGYSVKRFIIGFVNDKDVRKLMSLFPADAIYYFTRSTVERSLEAGKLVEIASQAGLHGKGYNSVIEAFNEANADSSPADLIYVGEAPLLSPICLIQLEAQMSADPTVRQDFFDFSLTSTPLNC